MTLDAKALAPCPFCGGSTVIVEKTIYGYGHTVSCDDCTAMVVSTAEPPIDSERDAVAIWNSRAALPQAGKVSEEIVAPAECDESCDDPDCPYSHKPLTLRQAYENTLVRLRAAEAALSSQHAEAVPVARQYRWKGIADEWSDWIITETDPNDWIWPSYWTGLETRPLYRFPSPADAGETAATAEALAKVDWSGVSIGNKALVQSAIEQLDENKLILDERDDRLALVDFIADKIGLPKSEELSQDNFALWLSARAGEPGIKALAWRPHISRAGWLVADVPPGGYFAWELAGLGYWSHGSVVGREVLGGIEAAKAAAQADYERRIRSALVPASQAKGEPAGPVPGHECPFGVGQPVRLAHPYPEMNPETVFYVTGIAWEHRRVSAHGWNIMVASKEDIEKGYGQTDGYSPGDLLPADTSKSEGSAA